MRLLVIPFILVAMLAQAPAPALGSTNQEAAEKIADIIGESFPDASVDVAYKGGQVWLKGEAGSAEQRKKIVEQVFQVTGVKVDEVNDEIQIVAPKAAPKVVAAPAQATSAVTAPVPVPMPSPAVPRTTRLMARQAAQPQPQPQPQVAQAPQPKTFAGAVLAPYPQPQYQAAYGLKPGQQSAVPAPYTPTSYAVPAQVPQQQVAPQQQYYAHQYRPAYYGPPAGAAQNPEAYGPQGPMPGQYNQPNLPDHAWPAYASYPNYAQVSYPRMYSPKAWPYIGPFYPYPQAPLGWRKVTLENHNGWWWLDFDDGTPSGPFSGLFRQPAQYTY